MRFGTIRELIENLQSHTNLDEKAGVVIWYPEDVRTECPDLPEGMEVDVLSQVINCHDANIGVNWDVISATASELLWEREELQKRLALITKEGSIADRENLRAVIRYIPQPGFAIRIEDTPKGVRVIKEGSSTPWEAYMNDQDFLVRFRKEFNV